MGTRERCAGEDPSGDRGWLHHPAVAQPDDVVRARSDLGVVGRDDECEPFIHPQGLQQVEDAGSGRCVEVAGRLVREDRTGSVREGARDRDTLLLAARELRRPVCGPRAKTDPPEHQAGGALGRVARRAAEQQRQRDVLARVEVRQQAEGLEDEPDGLTPMLGEGGPVETSELATRDLDRSVRRAVERADEAEERRLPRARGADDRGERACRDLEVDRIERANLGAADAVALPDLP